MNEYITRNARKESRVINPGTGHYFELDIWIPRIHLSFEFQVYFLQVLDNTLNLIFY